MKKISLLFIQAVIVLIGFVALYVLIRFPSTGGRAENLDLFSIYSDPFVLYGYAASMAFFCVVQSIQINRIYQAKSIVFTRLDKNLNKYKILRNHLERFDCDGRIIYKDIS